MSDPRAMYAERVCDWLSDPEYDRLRWAIAEANGRPGGSTTEDEVAAGRILSALRRDDALAAQEAADNAADAARFGPDPSVWYKPALDELADTP